MKVRIGCSGSRSGASLAQIPILSKLFARRRLRKLEKESARVLDKIKGFRKRVEEAKEAATNVDSIKIFSEAEKVEKRFNTVACTKKAAREVCPTIPEKLRAKKPRSEATLHAQCKRELIEAGAIPRHPGRAGRTEEQTKLISECVEQKRATEEAA